MIRGMLACQAMTVFTRYYKTVLLGLERFQRYSFYKAMGLSRSLQSRAGLQGSIVWVKQRSCFALGKYAERISYS